MPPTARRAFLLCVLAAAPLGACGDDAKPAPPQSAGAPGTPAAPPKPAAEPPDAPHEVRVLGEVPYFKLTDENGLPYGSGDLADAIWVVDFIFTRCAGTCPEQTRRMAQLQRDLEHHPRHQQIRFVSISVDPEHDTPAVLKTYARGKGADMESWHFLTGPREAIWDLSKQGFKLDVREDAGNADMPILHTTTFALVDSWGKIRGYFDGTSDTDMGRLRRDMETVLREKRRVMARSDIADPDWLDARQAAQLATRKDFGVFTDFTFQDRLPESGIKFVARSTPDGTYEYKLVHYDHFNGVSVADVDGDGLPDLFFPNQVGGNQLWRNLGGGKFEDITEASGVRMRTSVNAAGTFADFDNDGDPDLFVTSIRSPDQLFENDGKGHFKNVTETAGVGYSGHSSAGVPFDYDGDGLLDLFVANVGVFTMDATARVSREPGEEDLRYHPGYKDALAGHLKPERTENSVLYRNLGGMKFEDVTAATGLVDGGWTGDAAVFDVNQDGRPDLYTLNMQGHDHYWENDGGKRFVDKSAQVFPKTPWGSMGVKAFDYDGDQDLDLFITDMHSDMSADIGPEKLKSAAMLKEPDSMLRAEGRSIFGNALFRNDGGGVFTEVSDAMGAENYWPWGPSIADLNADGFPDVFIASSMCFLYRYGVNSVLLNDQGKLFRDAEFIVGVEPRRGRRTIKPWFELDFDGADKDHRFAKGNSGHVQLWDALGSRAAVVFDLDGDGDLDIVTNDYGSEPMVLISNLAEKKADLSFLQVVLVGSKSNRDGLGARVTVHAGGRDLLEVQDGKSGYISYSTLPLYFGLGSAAKADSVHVVWPSGTVQDVKDGIPHNGVLTIREP